MTLHEFLDFHFRDDGETVLQQLLEEGADPNSVDIESNETALHVAARRRRLGACEILLDHGADIDATNGGGKTAYAHSVRRSFNDIATLLENRGADTNLTAADEFAVAMVTGQLQRARELMETDPSVVRTGNPTEDRLLADLAGRFETMPVEMLIDARADLNAPGMDDGSPLHQACWFGQPANARMLIEAGAAIGTFDRVHRSSPLGWAVHGSRYSGSANERQPVYIELVQMLLEAGANTTYPDHENDDSYIQRLREDATSQVWQVLANHI